MINQMPIYSSYSGLKCLARYVFRRLAQRVCRVYVGFELYLLLN